MVVTYQQIKPAVACRYDAVSLGEVMLRLDPYDVPTARAREMRVFQGGGETNVACGLAYTFGLRAAVLTALVDDHVGTNIRNQLREAGVDTSRIIWFNTKSDGSRFSTDGKGTLMNGINFTFAGKGVIPSDTLYYRAHTPIRGLRPGDFDWAALFGREGVRVFNTGGIYTLISPSSSELALEAAELDRLVVIIDDLDRCLPKTAIATLEAIRLFLMVERTAFFIGADEVMIEYAVKEHFPDLPPSTGPLSYARNYLEKLIQVPVSYTPLTLPTIYSV